LQKYQRDSKTVLAICETQNVRLRNRQIARIKSNVGKPASELQVIPERMDPYQRVYICTHGWKPRIRLKEVRPRHKVNGMCCPMRFRTQVARRSPDEWVIGVKQAFYGHSNPVLEEIFQSYPFVRRIPISRIYDYIRERSPHYVQLKDVYNMISKIKSCGVCNILWIIHIQYIWSTKYVCRSIYKYLGGYRSDEDLVTELLVNFGLEALDNVADVNENSKGQTAVISVSSQRMRKLYKHLNDIDVLRSMFSDVRMVRCDFHGYEVLYGDGVLEIWDTRFHMDLLHFKNNTNNRLENFFVKLKANLERRMSMRQCLEATLRYQRRKVDEYATRVIMPGSQRHINYDDEMNQFLGMTSEWRAEIYLCEYKFAADAGIVKRYCIDCESPCFTMF
ncbi:hypothetical protein PHPALM_28613, partial [Phytophthora palmivora]